MKKRLSFTFVIFAALLFGSCENDVTNYGDYNLKSELSILSIKDSLNTSYENIKSSVRDTVFYEGKKAKLVVIDSLLLPKYKNRLFIHLRSNAKWNAPTIPFTTEVATWIRNDKVTGVCDGIIVYDIKPRATSSTVTTRRKLQNQYITTSDSMVMYKIGFTQKSMTEN